MNLISCIQKNYRIIILIILLIANTMFYVEKLNAEPKKITERINYKLVNEDGDNTMFIETNYSEVTLYLKVSPYIELPYPSMFTIFMNGKQVKCLWNNNNYSYKYHTIIKPETISLIPITIKNIPAGMNTLYFGTTYYPNEFDFKDNDLLNRKYSLDLVPFTIIRGNKTNWSQTDTIFKNYNQLTNINKDLPIGIYGELSCSLSDLIVSCNSKTTKKYYLWQNNDNIKRNVRFVLLKNWTQVPWPSGDMLIDVCIEPGEIFCQELLIPKIANATPTQLLVIAFIDPDKSFWYFDKHKELKAALYGTQAYATLRNVFF